MYFDGNVPAVSDKRHSQPIPNNLLNNCEARNIIYRPKMVNYIKYCAV